MSGALRARARRGPRVAMRSLRWIGALAVCMAVAPARADDAAVDALYDRLAAAYAATDAAALADVYAPDATVFPSRPDAAPLTGREAIRRGPGGFLTQAGQRGTKLELHFRVTQRRRQPGAVMDVGVYRLAITAAAGAPQVQVGKFATASMPQADGGWAFVFDTDTPMPAGAWDAARDVRTDHAPGRLPDLGP